MVMEKSRQQGSITIEAILSLSLFMFAYVAIISLAMIAKVESATQYAIDQVAKEISQYFYIAERLNLTNTDEGIKEIDDTVQAIVDFADAGSTAVSNVSSNAQDLLNAKEALGNISNDVESVTNAAMNLVGSFGTLLEDPKGIVKAFATLVGKQIGNEIMTKVIAQPICKALVPKYITSTGDADETLRKMGVVDGLAGLDFRMSSFLSDQRSINIVLVYQIKVTGFGIFDDSLVIKQTASTAAWVKGTSLKTVREATSKWEDDQLSRGKAFVSEIKDENNSVALRVGTGVDLYDQSTNTFTSVQSINIFSDSYSDYKSNIGIPALDYVLKEDKIEASVRRSANNLKSSVSKIGEFVTLEDGTQVQTALEAVRHRNMKMILVVPEEAGKSTEFLDVLNRIRKEVEDETGVKVEITYREKALD